MLANDKGQNYPINFQNILAALQVLANPSNSQSVIKSANQYLFQCEASPQFSLVLMQIIAQSVDGTTKTQALMYLKNIIKINWTANRSSNNSCAINPQVKQHIKAKLLEIYKQNWRLYYKQFNQIFKFLSRKQFPLNYAELDAFIRNVLGSLATLSLEQVVESEELLPYLSLVKVVYKQFAERRMLHSVEVYQAYISNSIQASLQILQKIREALTILKQSNQAQAKSGCKILQCSRKIDKILLYCLQSMVSSMQFNPQIIQIIKFQLSKAQFLLTTTNPNLKKQVELNILAIIELSSKLQIFYPLLFASLLTDYLTLILTLLFSQSFQTQKLTCSLIQACSRTINCFSYYMNSSQYKLSLQYKKQNPNSTLQNNQQLCYSTYLQIYNQANILMMLEKIVSQLMTKHPRESQDDEILFEDAVDEGMDQGAYEMLLDLVRIIFSRFTDTSKKFIDKIVLFLLNQNGQKSQANIIKNTYQIILQLPKAFDQSPLPSQIIFKLLQKCYYNNNYDIFCRILRNFMSHLSSQMPNFFALLIQIILSDNTRPHTVYQAAVCIRKILAQYEQLSLPLQQIGLCITKILQLISIYKTVPTHLWNLLNLLIQILKALNIDTVLSNLKYLNSCISMIIQNTKQNDNLILCALCDLMQSLLTLMDPEDASYLDDKLQLYQIALKLCAAVVQQQQQVTQVSKNNLWLCVVKNVTLKYCPQQLKSVLLNMLTSKKQQLISADPSLFFEILQQYLLGNILHISSLDLLNLYEQLVDQIQPQSEIRTLMSFFSLCHTYQMLTNDHNEKLLLISMKKIKELEGKITPSINVFRTVLMMIVCTGMLKLGSEVVFKLFNQNFGDYKIWFQAYFSSLNYTNNKYSAKLITIAIVNSITLLKDVLLVQIDHNLPFDSIIKFITFHVDPLPYDQSLSNYASSIKPFSHIESIRQKTKPQNLPKTHARKVKLHVCAQYAQSNLRQVYFERIGQLMRIWDWGADDLQQRYTNATTQKIKGLLNWQ